MSSYKDERTKHLRGQLAKYYLEGQDEKNKNAKLLLTLTLFVLLIFAGSEAVRIFFRKNFSLSSEGWVRVIICSLCFAVIAVLSFYSSTSADQFALNPGSPRSHFTTGILFSILTIALIIKAITGRNKTKTIYHEGTSNLLSFLEKDRWSQKSIQLWAEPLLTLSSGIGFSTFNLLGGCAIIACALSVWFYALYLAIFPDKSLHMIITRLNSRMNNQHQSYEINPE